MARDPGCAALARGLIARHFEGVVAETTLGDAQLIASELVSNAYLHGSGEIELVVGTVGDRLRIEVIDEGEGASVAVARSPGASPARGRGLAIVERLATAWGAHEGTTHVWAEVARG